MNEADWCFSDGKLSISGTRMKEFSRTSFGERWCFRHRRRHEFWHVIMVPDGISYYGPHVEIQGTHLDCTDLFPGWERNWDE